VSGRIKLSREVNRAFSAGAFRLLCVLGHCPRLALNTLLLWR